MSKNVFITGTSTGLGKAFAERYLQSNCQVYGLSRQINPVKNLHHKQMDLAKNEQIEDGLSELLDQVSSIDVVILNAGILGEIKALNKTSLDDIRKVMDINVWANKIIIDWLYKHVDVKQIILISSGAAVNGNKGWGNYSLSKATLNMLTKLYAAEMPDIHFTALAPGLVDTRMQDYLCDEQHVAQDEYPSVIKLRNARGSENMPNPTDAAIKMMRIFPDLLEQESGGFVDIRNL